MSRLSVSQSPGSLLAALLLAMPLSATHAAGLVASDRAGDDVFGYSVSLSGNSALVGAYRNDDAGNALFPGSAYVFRNLDTASGTITQNVKLTASDGAGG